jgi:hypothetical protein
MAQSGGPSLFLWSCGLIVTGGSACHECGSGPEAPTTGCNACAHRVREREALTEHFPVAAPPEAELDLVCKRCGCAVDARGFRVQAL